MALVCRLEIDRQRPGSKHCSGGNRLPIWLTPEQFHSLATNVDYLFVRLYKLFEQGPDGFVPTSIEAVKENNAPLFQGLMLRDELPPGFKLLGELRVLDERDIPFARVIKVERKAE